MDSTMIIQQGELAKYKITFTRADFDPEQRDFYIELHYGMMGEMFKIEKSNFEKISDMLWLFSFDTSKMVGKVVARLVLSLNDGDVSDNSRQEVDEQVIAFVVTTPCPRFLTCPACTGTHDVTYERTEDSGILTNYNQLKDVYGRALVTSDNKYIFVLRQ